ncbi:MAG: hypothetical protein R2730_15405 [Chitinophagales bacterium]
MILLLRPLLRFYQYHTINLTSCDPAMEQVDTLIAFNGCDSILTSVTTLSFLYFNGKSTIVIRPLRHSDRHYKCMGCFHYYDYSNL